MDKFLQEAIESYENQLNAVKPFYMDASTLMDIEEHYEKQGRDFEAEQVMRLAEKLHPQDNEVLIVKAYRLKAQGRWNEAKQVMNSVTDYHHREVQLFWAEWAIAGGDLEEALQHISAYITTLNTAERAEFQTDFCEILLDYGYYDKTLEQLATVPFASNQERRTLSLKAECLYQLQRYTEAIECTEKLINIDPYDALAWTQLAELQQKTGKWQESIDSCDYALAIDEDNRQAMNFKVYAAFNLYHDEEGLAMAREYIRKQPDDYALRLFVAEQLYDKHSYEEARTLLSEALRCCPPENAERRRIVIDMAYCLARLARPAEATRTMHTLTLAGFSSTEVTLQTAQILQECQYANDAIRLYSSVFFLPTTDQDSQVRILTQLYQTRCFTIAAPIWKQATLILLQPEHVSLYACMAYALHEIQSPAEFLTAVSLAQIHCPHQFAQIMQPIYHTANPDESVRFAIREAEQWKATPPADFSI